jgi:hypothetical protein
MKITDNDFQSFLRNATEIGIERNHLPKYMSMSRYACTAVMPAQPLCLHSRHGCTSVMAAHPSEIDNLKNDISVLSVD